MFRLLFVGDVYGAVGRKTLSAQLPQLSKNADFVVVNMENSAGGLGIHRDAADKALKAGAHCLTLGNHTWHHRDVYTLMNEEDKYPLVRPMNYSDPSTPGVGFRTFQVTGSNGAQERFTVVNLLGRVYMESVANPFSTMDAFLEQHTSANLGSVFVDFHAEATSEKVALGRYLDGRVAAVIGTHTHVPTADTRILRNGTAYQSDVGFTGPHESVIGADPIAPIQRFVTERPHRFQAADGIGELNAVIIEIENNKALTLERYRFIDS